MNKNLYVNGKLKTWQEEISTNFHGKSVPHEEGCEATAILKVSSMYQQGANYYSQVYIEEYKYCAREARKYHLLSDSEDELL